MAATKTKRRPAKVRDILLSPAFISRYGLLGNGIRQDEVELLINCTGIAPERKDTAGGLLYNPVALRAHVLAGVTIATPTSRVFLCRRREPETPTEA